MDSIINFFQWIADLIQTIIDFFVNLITSLIEFISMLPAIVTFTFGSISYLPEVVFIFATVSITVAITLLILGRSNNG